MLIQIKDYYYFILERYCGKISNYAWCKRWQNRERGTGYRASKEREDSFSGWGS